MSKRIIATLAITLLSSAVACDSKPQAEARSIVATQFQVQKSAVGHLSILAQGPFVRVEKRPIPGAPPPGLQEASGGGEYGVSIGIEPNNIAQWGSGTPTRSQVEAVFEGLGKNTDLHLVRTSLDGRRGILATTTALGVDEPIWTVIYFGADGLTIQVSSNSTGQVSREVCDQVLRSVRFDR